MTEPSKDDISELKAYVKGVLHGEVIQEQMGNCQKCGEYKDLRSGLCFDCAMPPCGLPEKHNGCNDVHRFRSLREKWYCTRPEGICQEEWDRAERQRLINSRPNLAPPRTWSKAKGNLRI